MKRYVVIVASTIEDYEIISVSVIDTKEKAKRSIKELYEEDLKEIKENFSDVDGEIYDESFVITCTDGVCFAEIKEVNVDVRYE